MEKWCVLAFFFSVFFVTGCVPKDEKLGGETGTEGCGVDEDGDGEVGAACTEYDLVDCDDQDPNAYHRAPEECDGVDQNCDGTLEWRGGLFEIDADADGFLSCEECDDGNATVYPGAEEICDGVDNDCDGAAEGEGDADADGFLSCEECDDGNATVYPGAEEICDGVDNDCDGSVDQGVNTTYYADVDVDGYGDNGNTVQACSPPTGYVENNGDCDDTNADIHPYASEDCKADIDSNCDGSVEYENADGDAYPACMECDDGNATVYPGAEEICDGVDNDCDGAAEGEGDADADGFLSCEECDDGNATVYPGAEEICDGVDNDCDGSVDDGCGVVKYETSFGDGGACSYAPFARSDGGSMAHASYDDGAGGCGVFVFGSGSSSGPSLSIDYSASGYTPKVEYTATMTLENLVFSAITVYTDFGGGSIVSETVPAGDTGTITVSWTADSSGSATLRVWSNYTTDYGAVVQDLVITY